MIFTREEAYVLIKEGTDNAQNGVLLVLLFEGLSIKAEFKELNNLKH